MGTLSQQAGSSLRRWRHLAMDRPIQSTISQGSGVRSAPFQNQACYFRSHESEESPNIRPSPSLGDNRESCFLFFQVLWTRVRKWESFHCPSDAGMRQNVGEKRTSDGYSAGASRLVRELVSRREIPFWSPMGRRPPRLRKRGEPQRGRYEDRVFFRRFFSEGNRRRAVRYFCCPRRACWMARDWRGAPACRRSWRSTLKSPEVSPAGGSPRQAWRTGGSSSPSSLEWDMTPLPAASRAPLWAACALGAMMRPLLRYSAQRQFRERRRLKSAQRQFWLLARPGQWRHLQRM